MKDIVTEIAKDFIKNIIEMFTEGQKSFAGLERMAFNEAKSCTAKLMSAYSEAVDAEIAADKAGRQDPDDVAAARGGGSESMSTT